MRAPTAAWRALEWLPGITAVAYVLVVLVRFPTLVRGLYWSSDAAGAFVLGELVHGHGQVEIPRFGWWSSLWWLVATRRLPGHEHLWEATGYVFALATVVLVGSATWRVAGRWAGVTAAAAAIVVGPKTLETLLTVNFHTSTPFSAALLAAYLVFVTRHRSWILAGVVGVLAGVNAASDPLLWIAGLAPFAVGAAVFALASKRLDVALRAAATVGMAAVTAITVDRLMSVLGFHVIPVGLQLAGFAELAPNFIALGKSIAMVFGANFLSHPTYPGNPVRYLVALIGYGALAAILLAALRLAIRRPQQVVTSYAIFWATGAIFVSIAYWASNLGSGGGPGGGLNYLLVLAPAAGVGFALLGAASSRGRIVVGLAVAAVGATNIWSLTYGQVVPHAGAEANGPQIVRLLERKHLIHGYAAFWDAQSVTWNSGMRVLVAPVQPCSPQTTALCRHPFFTMASWYQERPGRSFLIVDPNIDVRTKASPALGRPSETYHLDSGVVVYVYPYDLARHVRG